MSFDAGADDSAGSAAAVPGAPKRARFSGSDDLRLLQGVRLYQPYAAGHGRKIRMWEKIAQEIRLSTEKMSLTQLTGRAVSDRFQLLLKLHRSGSLRIKSPATTAEELNQVIHGMLSEISNRIEDIRTARGKHMNNPAHGASGDPMRHRTASPDMAISDVPADEDEEEKDNEDSNAATESMATLSRPSAKEQVRGGDEEDEGAASAEDAESVIVLQPSPEQQQQQHLTAQLIALKAEKLRLKKRKLEMLAQQHEEHMALLRQRLVLEERRFHEESVSRRREWQLLLEKLTESPRDGAPSPPDPPNPTI